MKRKLASDSNESVILRSKMPFLWQLATSFINGDPSFKENIACIIYPNPSSPLSKLDHKTHLNIVKYILSMNFEPIISADSLILGIANSYMCDNPKINFETYDRSCYRVSHIKAAAEFMTEVIIKIHLNDALKLKQRALLGMGHYQLEELLYTTLLNRAEEFGWVVTRDFRQGIMHVIDKTMLTQSARGNQHLQDTVRFALNKCINNWVSKLTSSQAEPLEVYLA